MINYNIIADSVHYYDQKGFKQIETPWTISQQIDDITRPKDKIPFQLNHNNKRLVASGEQSFLYLYVKGFLLPGQYQTITPCFRNEPFDFYHSKYFIKNELIKTDIVDEPNLNRMVNNSYEFFKQYLSPEDRIKKVKTNIGYDIEINDIEVGSYGIRQYEHLKWIYATGVAEPRFSNILKLINNGISH